MNPLFIINSPFIFIKDKQLLPGRLPPGFMGCSTIFLAWQLPSSSSPAWFYQHCRSLPVCAGKSPP